jgi:hypothetical protein
MADFRQAPGKPGVRGQRQRLRATNGTRDAIEYLLKYQEFVMEATSGLEPE